MQATSVSIEASEDCAVNPTDEAYESREPSSTQTSMSSESESTTKPPPPRELSPQEASKAQKTLEAKLKEINRVKLLSIKRGSYDAQAVSSTVSTLPSNLKERRSSRLFGKKVSVKKPYKCLAVGMFDQYELQSDFSNSIEELRQKFADYLQEDDSRRWLFCAEDLNRIQSDDYYLLRFLLHRNNNVTNAYKLLIDALRHKRENFYSIMGVDHLPAEMYMNGALFKYTRDRRNNVLVIARMRYLKKSPEIFGFFQAFMYHVFIEADKEAEEKGVAIIIDFSGVGLSNIDTSTLYYVPKLLVDYLPRIFSYVVLHNFPFVLQPILIIIKKIIPDEYSKLLMFSNTKSIREYVDEDKLPDFLHGTCKLSYTTAPDNCMPLYDVAKLYGFNRKIALDLYNKYKDTFDKEYSDSLHEQLLKLPKD